MERIKEGRPITIKDDKGNTSKCIADIVSVSNHDLFIKMLDVGCVLRPIDSEVI